MPLIVGLGNPGPKYEKTRHNVGFMVLDALKSNLGLRWTRDKKVNAQVAEVNLDGEKVVLAKPMTYMNNSGMAVQQLVQQFKFDPEDVWVVYDEATIPFGKLRVRKEGSNGGHNGLKSIIRHLNSEKVIRFRVGVDEPPEKMPLDRWVLSTFTKEELKNLEMITEKLAELLKKSIHTDIESITEDLQK